jgi:hypothetical protein
MTTVVVAETDAHPVPFDVEYVTTYDPGVLLLGFIAPVVLLIDNPAVEEYVPPVYAPAPVKTTL